MYADKTKAKNLKPYLELWNQRVTQVNECIVLEKVRFTQKRLYAYM